MKCAVFLDRDGTINVDTGFIRTWEQFRLLPRTIDGLRFLQESTGHLLVIVTNQSGIARGLLSESDFQRITENMLQLFDGQGIHIDGVYHCPHHPTEGAPPYRQECECRKPGVGMIRQATTDLGLDLARSVVVGDKTSDVQLGKNVGCRTILISSEPIGRKHPCPVLPDHVASDLYEAARIIASWTSSSTS